MGQHRDLKINYDNLKSIHGDIKSYVDALTNLQNSTNTFVSVINAQVGESFDELNSEFDDSISVNYTGLIDVLNDVYKNLGNYMTEMQALIAPENSGEICRVDSNDIWWNMGQIVNIPLEYISDAPAVPSHWYWDEFENPFADDIDEIRARNAERRRRRENNYNKLYNFVYSTLGTKAADLAIDTKAISDIHWNYVAEYENTDDSYAKKMDNIYDSIKTWKDFWKDVGDTVWDFCRGFGKGAIDLIKGLKAPLEIALALGPIPLPLGVRAILLIDGGRELYPAAIAFIKDPENTIGAIFQGMADTADEEGLAFSAGYITEKVVEAIVAKKVAEAMAGPKVEVEAPKTYSKTTLETLQNTENFTDSAIEHIFEGQINRRGNAVGYHYEGIENTAGKVVEGTVTSPNQVGIYQAKVEVNGIPKTGNGGTSTFFKRSMSPQEVVDTINEAYASKSFVKGNTYLGQATNGIVIEMYLDKAGKIISAFPRF